MRKILLLSLLGLMTYQTTACDGCSMYEYSTIKNRSYVGLFYRYRVFNGYKHLGHTKKFYVGTSAKTTHQNSGSLSYEKNSKDYEIYHSYEFRMNYAIKEKYNLLLVIPYQTAAVRYEKVFKEMAPATDTTFSVSGMSDVIVSVERVFQKETETWQHNFKLGLGLKLPTGKYKTESELDIYHPTLQPGTGSWDGILRMNYVGLYANTLGFSGSFNYRMNSGVRYEGEDGRELHYSFGNRLNMSFSTFYLITGIDFRIAPRLGAYVEDYGYDYRYDFREEGTGGVSLFGNVGCDFTYRDLTLQLLLQAPVAENLHDEQIGNAGRFVSGLIYNF